MSSGVSDLTPVGSPCSEPSAAEAAAIMTLVGDATVIGFGEIAHGFEEPLAYRNRLVRFLVERRGLLAVVLESGIAQGRRIDAFVCGGAGEATEIARKNLSWGFNKLAANVELIRWLRAYNENSAQRPVHFYGMDLTGGDSKGSLGHAREALHDLTSYLEKYAPIRSKAVRASLAPFMKRFTPEAYRRYSPVHREQLRTGLEAAQRLLKLARASLINASSADDYDWALRVALDCRRLVEAFNAWPADRENLRAWLDVTRVRDGTMADHVSWILDREGWRGPLLVFASDGHVAAAEFWLERIFQLRNRPWVMGRRLRARLGDAYRVIVTAADNSGTVAAEGSHVGTLNVALSGCAPTPFLVDFRRTPKTHRLHARQSISQGGDILYATPGKAFDGLLFLGPLTPAVRISE